MRKARTNWKSKQTSFLNRSSHIDRNTQTDDKLLRECSTQVSETLLKSEYIFLAVCTFYCHNLINKLVLLFCSLSESDFR